LAKAHAQDSRALYQKIKKHHQSAEEHFTAYKDHKDVSKFEKMRAVNEGALKELEAELKSLLEKLKTLGTAEASKIQQQLSQLMALLSERWQKLKSKQDEVLALAGGNADDKKRKQMADRLKRYDDALQELDTKIKQTEEVLSKHL